MKTHWETKLVRRDEVSRVPPTICLTAPLCRSMHGRKTEGMACTRTAMSARATRERVTRQKSPHDQRGARASLAEKRESSRGTSRESERSHTVARGRGARGQGCVRRRRLTLTALPHLAHTSSRLSLRATERSNRSSTARSSLSYASRRRSRRALLDPPRRVHRLPLSRSPWPPRATRRRRCVSGAFCITTELTRMDIAALQEHQRGAPRPPHLALVPRAGECVKQS